MKLFKISSDNIVSKMLGKPFKNTEHASAVGDFLHKAQTFVKLPLYVFTGKKFIVLDELETSSMFLTDIIEKIAEQEKKGYTVLYPVSYAGFECKSNAEICEMLSADDLDVEKGEYFFNVLPKKKPEIKQEFKVTVFQRDSSGKEFSGEATNAEELIDLLRRYSTTFMDDDAGAWPKFFSKIIL